MNEIVGKILEVKNISKMFKKHAKMSLAKDGTCARKLTLKKKNFNLNLHLAKSPSKNWDMKKVELKGEKLVKLK